LVSGDDEARGAGFHTMASGWGRGDR
jgi:hypothetical protein